MRRKKKDMLRGKVNIGWEEKIYKRKGNTEWEGKGRYEEGLKDISRERKIWGGKGR